MKLLTSQTAADGCSFVFNQPNDNHDVVQESRPWLKLHSFFDEKKEGENDSNNIFDWDSQTTTDNIIDLPLLKTQPHF